MPPPIDQVTDTEVAIEAASLAFDPTPDPALTKRPLDESACSAPAKSMRLRLFQKIISHSKTRMTMDAPAGVPLLESAACSSSQHSSSTPTPFSGDQWLRRLTNLFAAGSAVECEEEGPIAYVEVWLIQHHTFPVCTEPRSAKLQANPRTKRWKRCKNEICVPYFHVSQRGIWDISLCVNVYIYILYAICHSLTQKKSNMVEGNGHCFDLGHRPSKL